MDQFLADILHEFSLPLSNPVLVFSLILFIILLAPIVLKVLKLPGIIGLIVSGVVIGPFGLNILEKTSAIELFSTIGLLYIMFMAGLELDMNEFKTNRKKSLLFGFFTFAMPLSIGYPVCRYLLGYDINASFLTASMFATHTLVAYPIVSQLGISKKQAVAVTVGGTILTDTAVLVILAVIVGNHEGGLTSAFWIKLLVSLAVFSAIMFAVIPRIAKWFFTRLESEKHTHYIFVLSVVFFAAFLAELAGVEPIIGAFVSGLTLNRLIPHASALMNRIEFIGNALFVPFFLISVGMLVDVSVLTRGPIALIVAATLSVVALAGKWVAAWLTQQVFKYSADERRLIFGLSSAHAAATLAVILVGYQANILDENILNGTILLILVTCVVASFVTEKAARSLVLNANDSDVAIPNQPLLTHEHILFPYANMATLPKLLEFVLLIKDHKSPNPVTMLTVVPNNDEAELNLVRSKAKLREVVKEASAVETPINILATIDHNVASGITRTSREIMADIIVLGWPQTRFALEKLMGEKIETILSGTDRSLFIVQAGIPLVAHTRILLFTPPLTERENGFSLWVQKVIKLSKELSIPIVHYGHPHTQAALAQLLADLQLNSKVPFEVFNEWDDFPESVSDFILPNDLLVVVSARKNSLSYQDVLDSLPNKLDKYFEHHNKVIIYPQMHNQYVHFEAYDLDHSTGEPIKKGLEVIEKLGRGLGGIFGWGRPRQ